jgi:protein-disulfide isomerase
MTFSKPLLAGIAAALVAGFLLASYWYRGEQSASQTETAAAGQSLLIRPYSLTLGPDSAPVTIVEFLDPECESCGAMYPIVKQVLAEFSGRVRLVIRYMPLHQNAGYASVLLEAARAQDKYWDLADVMFQRQGEWASHHAPRPELLMTYAGQVGLDVERLRAATTDPELRRRVQQDQADGVALGVDRTPTFFVNGQRLARIGYAPLRDAVQAELSR